MELWTLQHPNVWKTIQQEGVWHAKDDLIEFPKERDDHLSHFHYVYQWYVQQMCQRVGPPPSGVHFPIWAYAKQGGRKDGKPDMRAHRWWNSGKVDRLRLEICKDRVLISDYMTWHFPLNYSFLARNEREDIEFENWCEANKIPYRSLSDWSKKSDILTKARQIIEDSWDRIFDINALSDEYWHGTYASRTYQATFWELKREDIISVEHFQCVGPPKYVTSS